MVRTVRPPRQVPPPARTNLLRQASARARRGGLPAAPPRQTPPAKWRAAARAIQRRAAPKQMPEARLAWLQLRGSSPLFAALVATSSWVQAGFIDLRQELPQMFELIAVDGGIRDHNGSDENNELCLLHRVIAKLECFANSRYVAHPGNLIGVTSDLVLHEATQDRSLPTEQLEH